MSNLTNIYSDILAVTSESDFSYQEENKDGYSQDTKVKRDGTYDMCLSEIRNPFRNYSFFVFYLVETDDPTKKVNFLTYKWKVDPNIKRYVKISGNTEKTISISAEEHVDDDYHVARRIIVKNDLDYAVEKNEEGEEINRINIDEIRSSIQDKDIDIFFGRFTPLEVPQKKVKEIH